MRALLFQYSVLRYLLSRSMYSLNRRFWSVKQTPLSYVQLQRPEPQAADWVRLQVRLSGICGTDLSLVTGSNSLYLEPEASYPFVPGHELVGEVDDAGQAQVRHEHARLEPGTRAAVWPVLGCRTRGVDTLCKPCAAGWDGFCERRDVGWQGAGIAIGFNSETGGGWSEACLAHRSQLWPLSDAVTDEDAVLLDPAITALGALLRTERPGIERTLVVGGGTIGLLTGYLHNNLQLPGHCRLLVRHSFQYDWSRQQGIDAVMVRRERDFRDWAAGEGMTSRHVPSYGHVFSGGFDRVIVTAGSASAFQWAMHAVRPGGQLVLLASPNAFGSIDPTPLWYREITLRGILAYAPVPVQNEWVHPFALLLPELERGNLSFKSLLTHVYPLQDYASALDTALSRSASSAIKVAFRPGASNGASV